MLVINCDKVMKDINTSQIKLESIKIELKWMEIALIIFRDF